MSYARTGDLLDRARAEFDDIWQTLVRTGVADRLQSSVTVTPGLYRGHQGGAEDLTLPPMDGIDMHPGVRSLPPLSVVASTDDDETSMGELRLREELGKGGMGSVFLADQTSLRREVAVKRLHQVKDGHIDALLREARILGALSHPNIVPVHALARDEQGHPVLVMKRIEGDRWTQLLPKGEPPDPVALERHLDILKGVCHALEYAHSKRIIHRDIKPGNVLVGEFGEVMVVDWGVSARMGEPHPQTMLGTPAYMAPEMVEGLAPDERTDVYLLGATLHRILTGRARHKGKNMQDSLLKAFVSAPVEYGPDVPAELATVANRATAARPDDRYPDVASFRRALEAFETHRTSRQLALAAHMRLEQLTELLRTDDAEPRRISEVGGGCRFALKQALDAWPGNEPARRDLMSCLELMTRFRLSTGEPKEAKNQMEQLLALASPEQRLQLAALDDEVDAAVRRDEALHRLGREMDLSVASGWRLAFLLFFAATSAVVGAGLVALTRSGLMPNSHLLGVAMGWIAVAGFSLVFWVGRRRLMTSVVNQRIMFSLYVPAVAIALFRSMAWWMDQPLHTVLVTDVILLALGSAMAAVGINLRLFWLTAFLVLAALAGAAFPALAFEFATTAVVMSGVVLAGVFAVWVRK